MVMPGDNTSLTVKLIQPIAMEKGLKFAIREGGRTVGAGTAGNLTTDTHLAALAIEHDAELVTFDRDFERFVGLRMTLLG